MAVILTPTDTVRNSDSGFFELDEARASAMVTIGGRTFVYIGGSTDDGISGFELTANGTLTNVVNLDDASDATLELNGVRGLTTAVVGTSTYLFAAGDADNGVSVFLINSSGSLTEVDSVDDAADPD